MGYLADRLSGYLTRREARRFAAGCEPGDTVYSVTNLADWMTPSGPAGRREVPRSQKWECGRKSRVSGFCKVGHMDVAQLYLQEGPLFRQPPGGLIDVLDLDGQAKDDAARVAAIEKALKKAVDAR